MINIQELQHKPIKDIIKILETKDSLPVDLVKLAGLLNVSVLSHNFKEWETNNKDILCAFVTNEEGRSCIFYNVEILDNKDFLVERVPIVQTFARYILTGNKNFYINEKTKFTSREKRLAYEILMPASQVEEVLNKLILPTTYSLAKIFKVSQEFVRERLDEIGTQVQIAGYNF